MKIRRMPFQRGRINERVDPHCCGEEDRVLPFVFGYAHLILQNNLVSTHLSKRSLVITE